jgi:predicted nucleic acid-binding protein
MGSAYPRHARGEPAVIEGSVRDIHLDTSFLIRALVPGSVESETLREWMRARRTVAICTLAWGEFLCEPLDDGLGRLARRVVRRHIPLGTDEAAAAAHLFNETGRRRGSFQDCIVAATAVTSGAALATTDRADFVRFVSQGLQMAEP